MAHLPPTKQGAEASIPDGAAADVLVVVDVGAGRRAAVVEVEEAKSGEAHHGVELAECPTDPARAVEPAAGGVGVAGVEADADALLSVEEIEEVGKLAPFAPHFCSPACGVLEQNVDAGRRLRQQRAHTGGDESKAAACAGSHVVAEVEHDAAPPQERRALHVVGDAAEGAFSERAIGGSEIH